MRTGKKKSSKRDMVLLNACRENDLVVLGELLGLKTIRGLLIDSKNKALFDKRRTTPLLEATSRGFDEAVRLLLQAGADVNGTSKYGETALAYAAGNGHIDVVKRLLAAGADPNCVLKGPATFSALSISAARGHLQVVELLVDAGANVEGWNEPHRPLPEAASGKHLEIVRYLLSKGADPNGQGELGGTALTILAGLGIIEGVELLLKHGAGVNVVHRNGMSPLISACGQGHLETAKLLLDKGADPTLKVSLMMGDQKNALLYAVYRKRREIVSWLIKRRLPFEKGDVELAKRFLEQ